MGILLVGIRVGQLRAFDGAQQLALDTGEELLALCGRISALVLTTGPGLFDEAWRVAGGWGVVDATTVCSLETALRVPLAFIVGAALAQEFLFENPDLAADEFLFLSDSPIQSRTHHCCDGT